MSSDDLKFDQDYHIEEDSDPEDGAGPYRSSSDDDLERSLNKDFGSMENELNKVKELSDSEGKEGLSSMKKSYSKTKASRVDRLLNPELFDDDEMDEDECQRFPIPSNDDLLYDPGMDERDQRWADRQRARHKTKTDEASHCQSGKSDAILSCPACMSTVCIDCQRHEIYRHQYRAMFVMNVDVVMDEILRYEAKRHKGKKKKRGPMMRGSLVREESSELSMPSLPDEEHYHPVKCTECRTEVAVYDKEEIYHFFNVLASQA